MQQWIPLRKFLSITAILDESGEASATEPSRIISSLADFWRPVFDGSRSQPNETKIEEVLTELKDHSWDWTAFELPGPRQFSQVISSAIDSSPGKDGIPYSGLDHKERECSTMPYLLKD
eukprot:1686125-Karenia_brevis.AAC.1